MQELISKKLDKMSNIADKAILKDLINDIFLEVYAESEQKYKALEQRVRDELPFIQEKYAVYTTVMRKSELNVGHDFFSPMILEEIEDCALAADELTAALGRKEQPVVGTVFYKAGHKKCLQPDFEGRVFDGTIEIETKRYPFKCILSPTKRYLKLIEKIYSVFRQNAVRWTTVNSAYLNKFFDIHLISLHEALPAKAVVDCSKIHIAFGEYGESVQQDVVPVWNIDKHQVEGDGFPIPILNSKNYEYRFDTSVLGAENGYLADSENTSIRNIRLEDDSVIVISPQSECLFWDLYRFRKHKDRAVDNYKYPILSNARKDTFSARLAEKYSTAIKTKADLHGLVMSFHMTESITLETIRVTAEKTSAQTYDMNQFMIDEIRDPGNKKSLLLGFKMEASESFLTYDLLSFVTSEVQQRFPEYNCVGTLI